MARPSNCMRFSWAVSPALLAVALGAATMPLRLTERPGFGAEAVTSALRGNGSQHPGWAPDLRAHWDNGRPVSQCDLLLVRHPPSPTKRVEFNDYIPSVDSVLDSCRRALPMLANVTGAKVYNATRATGVYVHP